MNILKTNALYLVHVLYFNGYSITHLSIIYYYLVIIKTIYKYFSNMQRTKNQQIHFTLKKKTPKIFFNYEF